MLYYIIKALINGSNNTKLRISIKQIKIAGVTSKIDIWDLNKIRDTLRIMDIKNWNEKIDQKEFNFSSCFSSWHKNSEGNVSTVNYKRINEKRKKNLTF